MAAKKTYLIKVWDMSVLKTPALEQVKDFKTKSKQSYVVEEQNTSDGFDLLQERIIKCYETNIKNLCVPKGLRATYEEVKEKIATPKKDRPKTVNTNR